MAKDKDAIDRVHEARSSVFRSFQTKWTQMEENAKFLRLEQYSSDQLKKMAKDSRVPYVLDNLNSSMNTFQGIQRDRRTEIYYYPVEKEDEVKTEILNAVKDSALQENNFVYLESDVFRDGLVEKVGAVGYEWSREKNKNGALRMFRIPPRQLMWDLNEQEPEGDRCTWMSYHRWFGKRDLINRHPDMAKKIERMPFWDGDDTISISVDRDYVNAVLNHDLNVVALIEFFEKKYETRYFIRRGGFVLPLYYDTEKEAAAAAKEAIEKEAARFTAAGIIPPPPEAVKIFPDKFPTVKKTCIAHETLFSEETIDEPFYPISKYHPYFHDGEYWSPLDVQKDGQRFFNKMFTMADHWIGTQAKGLLLIDSKAPKQEREVVKKTFSTTGGAVDVSDVENYKLMESKGPAPQLFSMLGLAQQNLSDNSGGKNFMGKKETASESGIAVRQRIEQGGLSQFVIYDNHRRWKIDVGTKLAWYLTTYMTYPTVVRIMGDELVQETMQKFQQTGMNWFKTNSLRPGVGYMEINTGEHNTIEGIKVDVIVDEARWSVSKNQSTLETINGALQSNPLFAQTFPPEVLLELIPLPFSEKEKARRRMKELEERTAQLEAAKAIKPPNVSLDLGDVEKLPPGVAAQILMQYFKVQADPSQMQSKDGEKAKIDIMKSLMELQIKEQEGQLKLRQKAQEIGLGSIQGEQKLGFAERNQALKEKNNGSGGS